MEKARIVERLSCECLIKSREVYSFVEWCPLHAAAPEMLDLLRAAMAAKLRPRTSEGARVINQIYRFLDKIDGREVTM